ncbi:MAG: S8 family serine peptidase, partial [Synergistaceae bacterium]|nr:S8 family serine peptidase [Synergistaceae bacterium]
MRKLLAVLAFLVLAVSPSLAGDAVPGDLIIVIRKNTSARTLNTDAQAAAHSFAQSQNLSVTHTFDALSELGGYSFVTVHSDTEDENTLLQRLKSHPEVAAASLNRIITLDLPKVPDDTEYFRLWGMQAVNATQAWTLGTGSDDVYVAVVDTGIDYNHPDLRDNFSHEYSRNFVGVNRAGYDPSAYIDRHSHGTHVAGTIAGVGNNAL